MEFVIGDLLRVLARKEGDALAFTSSSTLDAQGRLVMEGYGAKRVKTSHPDIEWEMGEKIGQGVPGVHSDYLVMPCFYWPLWVLAVQTHRLPHEEEPSKDLVLASLDALADVSDQHPERRIILECPLVWEEDYEISLDRMKELVSERLDGRNVVVCLPRRWNILEEAA